MKILEFVGLEPDNDPGTEADDELLDVLLCFVEKRHVYVPIHGQVVRHHGDSASLDNRYAAPLEHVVAAEDGQTALFIEYEEEQHLYMLV